MDSANNAKIDKPVQDDANFEQAQAGLRSEAWSGNPVKTVVTDRNDQRILPWVDLIGGDPNEKQDKSVTDRRPELRDGKTFADSLKAIISQIDRDGDGVSKGELKDFHKAQLKKFGVPDLSADTAKLAIEHYSELADLNKVDKHILAKLTVDDISMGFEKRLASSELIKEFPELRDPAKLAKTINRIMPELDKSWWSGVTQDDLVKYLDSNKHKGPTVEKAAAGFLLSNFGTISNIHNSDGTLSENDLADLASMQEPNVRERKLKEVEKHEGINQGDITDSIATGLAVGAMARMLGASRNVSTGVGFLAALDDDSDQRDRRERPRREMEQFFRSMDDIKRGGQFNLPADGK